MFGADQQPRGSVDVRIRHDPIDLVRATQRWEMSGEIDRSFTYVRTRSNGNRHTYDGPDLWGNALAYGRALYTTQHHAREAFKVKGREFIIDRDYTLAAVWKLYDRRPHDRHRLRRPHLVAGLLAAKPPTRNGSRMHAICA